MMRNVEMKQVTHSCRYLVNAWITELKHFVAIQTDQVIVLAVIERFLEARLVISKLMPYHKITFLQEVESIINGSPTDVVAFLLHLME